MSKSRHIAILGGGMAGLATGYYARKNGIPFTIFEARGWLGGNCITIKHGDFLFDSGAHRFCDKYEEITKEIKALNGEDLKKVSMLSQIYRDGKFIDFPLSPLNLLKNLGLYIFTKVCLELTLAKFKGNEGQNGTFENFAFQQYGITLANAFFLNYSEKLWGRPCDKLSPYIAGKRLKGFDLTTFLIEAIWGQNAKIEHLEGPLYYPKKGIGSIIEKLADYCGEENILKNSRITKILHNSKRIFAVEVNGKKRIDTDGVVSTLPLDYFLQIMEPPPPQHILLLAKSLRHRNVILVTLFLNRESITKSAAVYFPNSKFSFTRIHEPKNRSIFMSPTGKTSLVAEIPCQEEDELWNLEDEKLIRMVSSQLVQIGWIKEEEILDALVTRMPYAYPVLEKDFEDKIQKIFAFLNCFDNLKLSGRNGRFLYIHMHDMMKLGKEIINGYISEAPQGLAF